MTLYHSIASWVLKKRHHQIELFMKYPNEVQQEWFTKLTETASNTVFGKEHDFGNITSLRDFQEKVPLQDYESLKSYILRTKHGEQNLLWPTDIKWFAKSSGTTSDRSKFLPVTKESLEECHYKGGKDLLSIYFHHFENSQLFSGKALVIGGSSEVNQFSPNSYYGDLSSIIIKNLPLWAEFVRVPGRDIVLMPEWEEKIEKIAQAGKDENITQITGVPSWNLVLLNRILEITGKENMLEVWPNFELYVHGGVSFTPYREQYNRLFPSEKVNYIETYNASEGFFGIQDTWHGKNEENDMLLMLDYGIFYEFIPIERARDEQPKTIGLDEVELGKVYALVISTNAGLWRYQIGDTIEFTSLSPYRIRVAGRVKYFINAFGEELMYENAEHALEVACSKTDAVVAEFTAGPVYASEKEQGKHEWVIEFEKEPENLAYFEEVLDTALKAVNSDYEAKRYQDMSMGRLRLINAPKGTFYRWMKERGKLGGQNKVPRLQNNRKILDSVLQFLQKNQ